MKNINILSLTFFILFFLFIPDVNAESGVYVGGHIRRQRPKTITKLKNSGFTYVILFNVHVGPDGTLLTDGDTICHKGKYVFAKKHPFYVSDVKSLMTSPTSIQRIEICIGGWGNTAYDNIKSLVNSEGVGENSILYKNFKALRETIPEITAVNNDDEHTYHVATATSFHVMMFDLGYKTTLAPYMNKSFWKSITENINAQRPSAVDRIMIQCYDGGANNNPSDWHFGTIPLHAGRLNYQNFAESKTVIQDWKNNKGVVGAFFWVYNDETWNLSKYATAVNRIFGTLKTSENPVVNFYEDTNFGGYMARFPEGKFTTSEMVAYGLADDDVTSLQIKSGYKVTIYANDNFQGDSLVFTAASSWIGSTFNDKTSSVKIENMDHSAVIAPSSDALNVKMYPNPVTDHLFLELKTPTDISIHDISGRLLHSGLLSVGANQIYVGDLLSGVYFVNLTEGSVAFNKMIIKN